MLARDDAVERGDLGHHRVNTLVDALEHGPVIRQHRNVDVHVAVAGVHVRGDDDATVAHLLVGARERIKHGRVAAHQPLQIMLKGLERGERAQCFWLFLRNLRAEVGKQSLARGGLHGKLLRVVAAHLLGKNLFGALGKTQLRVAFFGDVDAIDIVRELGQRRKRQHDVLVHLEGIGAAGNGAELLAVLPEACALFLVARHKHRRVGMRGQQSVNAIDAARGLLGVITGHVDQQHGQRRLRARRLHLVMNRANIFVVKVLERQQRLFMIGREGKGLRQLDDHLAGLFKVFAEELEADGLLGLVCGVKHEARRGNHAVGAFFLQAGHAAERLVGDVLPQPLFANLGAAQLN